MTTRADRGSDAKIRAGVGSSRDRSAQRAGREAVESAIEQLNGATADVLLLFGTTGYDQERLLAGANEAAAGVPVVGCSTEGIIADHQSDEGSHVVGVMALQSSLLRFSTCSAGNLTKSPRAAAAAIAQHVSAVSKADEDNLLLVFPDGLNRGCKELVDMLDQLLPCPMLVAGGGAGGILNTWKTYQYQGNQVFEDGVSALLIRGRFVVDVAISHGCEPMGLERTITDASEGSVRTIDGKPAWEVFKEYIEGAPEDLMVEDLLYLSLGRELPVEQREGYGPLIIGAAAGHDKATGSLFFPLGFEAGDKVYMTRRDPERILKSAVHMCEALRARHPGQAPSFILQFDCGGRGRALLGDKTTATVVEPLQRVLGTEVPWLGSHTFGEIAPLAGKTYYHNYTVALCAVYERP